MNFSVIEYTRIIRVLYVLYVCHFKNSEFLRTIELYSTLITIGSICVRLTLSHLVCDCPRVSMEVWLAIGKDSK